MVNSNCICYIYNKETVKFKLLKKIKECVLCNKFICKFCNESIETFLSVEDKYKKKNISTICICCIANLLFNTKNFDLDCFIKKIKNKIEFEEIINNEKNETCSSCVNFKNNFFYLNFKICYIPLYKSFIVKKKIESISESGEETVTKLIKIYEKCFDEKCFYCLVKLFNLNDSNSKFINVILTRFNKLKNLNFKKINIEDSVFSYCYQRKNIISMIKKNVKVNIIILEKENPNDKENYHNNYKKYFSFHELKEIDRIKEIFSKKQKKNETTLNIKISKLFVKTEKMFIKNILEYINNSEIDLKKYKFYIQYNLQDEFLSSYLSDVNNYKKNINNIPMFENIYTIQNCCKIKERIREEIKKHGYKYAVTLDIKNAYYNVLINYPEIFFDLIKIYDEEIVRKIVEFFNNINKYHKNNFLPITSLSHYIFANFMYSVFFEYKKENILMLCDDMIIFSHTFEEIIENLKYILILLIVKRKLVVNFNKVKFYKIEKQNLYFTSVCVNPSKSLSNIINKWKTVLYKPDSSIYYKKAKEEFYSLYLNEKKDEEKKILLKNKLKEEIKYLKDIQKENKKKKNNLDNIIYINEDIIKKKTNILKDLSK